ncbi:MAG: hypothetical protein V1727_00590 [Candidatus Omnitrophota bacterium]
MKVRLFVLFILALGFVLAQSTLVRVVTLFGVKPDIVVILVMFISLWYGRINAALIGLFCGFFVEITSGLPAGAALGPYVLGGLILAHLASVVWYTQWYTQRVGGQMLIAFLFTFTIYLFQFFLLRPAAIELSLLSALVGIILPVSLYTAGVSPLLFYLLNTIAAPLR